MTIKTNIQYYAGRPIIMTSKSVGAEKYPNQAGRLTKEETALMNKHQSMQESVDKIKTVLS